MEITKENLLNDNKISILIVDDEPDLLEIYRDVFEMEDFKVFAVSSGAAAIEIYKNNLDIDVIISDSHMQGMTGLEFLKYLKVNFQKIPLFYLATGELEQTQEAIISLGGNGLILKPFDVDEIIVKIKKDLNL